MGSQPAKCSKRDAWRFGGPRPEPVGGWSALVSQAGGLRGLRTDSEIASQGVIHGKTIELEQELGLAEGQRVAVDVRLVDEPPVWLGRLVVDPAVNPAKLVIKGTRLLVDDLVRLVEEQRNDRQLRQLHPELTPADLEAIRQYARVPAGLRQSFGGWAEDAEELDEYLEWTRQQRKVGRREVEE